jgi:hypothetical protein
MEWAREAIHFVIADAEAFFPFPFPKPLGLGKGKGKKAFTGTRGEKGKRKEHAQGDS